MLVVVANIFRKIRTTIMSEQHQQPPSHPNLKPYPPAEKDMQRLVLVLDGPRKEDPKCGAIDQEQQTNREVELIAGTTMETDGINKYQLLGTDIVKGTVSGWGVPYWTIHGNPERVRSTRMRGENPDVQLRFVPGATHKVRYNSRLPVVIYCPHNMECRYRIWKADPTASTVQAG